MSSRGCRDESIRVSRDEAKGLQASASSKFDNVCASDFKIIVPSGY